ncbi:hypothetical protein TNCV_3683281 [Trichonephila clavipes]|nr:hypothetical protein TNCV_3683281 [Trichonephila clavipes]
MKGLVDIDSSVNSGSEYQSNSSSGPRKDQSQGFSSKENQDKKKRPPNKSDHKRRLPSSISPNQVATKRNRRTEENNEQILARGSRPGPAVERPLQSSLIQPGRSSSYNMREKRPGKPVPNLQKEQYKPKRDQSGPEETSQGDQVPTA